MPGITPKVADFARRVAAIGCTAVMPHLFGEPGPGPDRRRHGRGVAAYVRVVDRARRASAASSRSWATGRTSPVVDWLRALAADEHERCGGPGVGAVGMCFTGGFALAMATDDRLLAPVLSQPSLPVRRSRPSSGARSTCSPEDLASVKDRCAGEGLQVLGLRFKGDRFVPGERFEFLREQLGDAFVAVELEDDAANPDAADDAALGAHRAPRRRAGPADAAGARPGARPVPHPPAHTSRAEGHLTISVRPGISTDLHGCPPRTGDERTTYRTTGEDEWKAWRAP